MLSIANEISEIAEIPTKMGPPKRNEWHQEIPRGNITLPFFETAPERLHENGNFCFRAARPERPTHEGVPVDDLPGLTDKNETAACVIQGTRPQTPAICEVIRILVRPEMWRQQRGRNSGFDG